MTEKNYLDLAVETLAAKNKPEPPPTWIDGTVKLPPGTVTDSTGHAVDLDRAAVDSVYFQKNANAVRSALQKRATDLATAGEAEAEAQRKADYMARKTREREEAAKAKADAAEAAKLALLQHNRDRMSR